MQVKRDSLNCVINGDWNRKYVEPRWIGEELFGVDELGIALKGMGTDASISYKSGNIVVDATQSQFSFGALDLDEKTLILFESTICKFMEIATTPKIESYGFNCIITESDLSRFASIVDKMEDNQLLINGGIEIIGTQISRRIRIDDKIININTVMDGDELDFIFNEHHENKGDGYEDIKYGDIKKFINRCIGIVKILGYQYEGDDEE